MWTVDGGQSLGLLRSVGKLIYFSFWMSVRLAHVSVERKCAMLERKTSVITHLHSSLHQPDGRRDFLSLPLPKQRNITVKVHRYAIQSCVRSLGVNNMQHVL